MLTNFMYFSIWPLKSHITADILRTKSTKSVSSIRFSYPSQDYALLSIIVVYEVFSIERTKSITDDKVHGRKCIKADLAMTVIDVLLIGLV